MKKFLLAFIVFALPSVSFAVTRTRASLPVSCPVGYHWQTNLAEDGDGDGVPKKRAPITACVGEKFPNILTPFVECRGIDGRQYIDLKTANQGEDCNDSDIFSFQLVLGAKDFNHNGYYAGPIEERCVGRKAFIDGRPYYEASDGISWLDIRYALGSGDTMDDIDIFVLGVHDSDHDGYGAEDKAVQIPANSIAVFVDKHFYYKGIDGLYNILAVSQVSGFSDRDDNDKLVH